MLCCVVRGCMCVVAQLRCNEKTQPLRVPRNTGMLCCTPKGSDNNTTTLTNSPTRIISPPRRFRLHLCARIRCIQPCGCTASHVKKSRNRQRSGCEQTVVFVMATLEKIKICVLLSWGFLHRVSDANIDVIKLAGHCCAMTLNSLLGYIRKETKIDTLKSSRCTSWHHGFQYCYTPVNQGWGKR